MAVEEGFPVSDMAVSRANRSAERAAAHDDPALQIASLVANGINGFSRVSLTAEYVYFLSIDRSDFLLGVLSCAKGLVNAGLELDEGLLEGLKEQVRQIELGVSTYLESNHQGDIRELYLPEDGGNG